MSAIAEAPGCTKVTLSPLGIEKDCHWMMALLVLWRMTVLLGPVVMVAWPAVTAGLTCCARAAVVASVPALTRQLVASSRLRRAGPCCHSMLYPCRVPLS